jgi:ATP-dependent DNA ligase
LSGLSHVIITQCEFSCEYKYDGERAQVHLTSDGKVFIYSRNSENNTSKFPDIVEFLPSVTKPGVTAVVLDCEAVAYDREEKKILPFQVRVHRAPRFLLALYPNWETFRRHGMGGVPGSQDRAQ